MNVTQAETRLAVKFPALIASSRHGVLPPVTTSVYILRCSDYNRHAHPNDRNQKETGPLVRKNITPAWYSRSLTFKSSASKPVVVFCNPTRHILVQYIKMSQDSVVREMISSRQGNQKTVFRFQGQEIR